MTQDDEVSMLSRLLATCLGWRAGDVISSRSCTSGRDCVAALEACPCWKGDNSLSRKPLVFLRRNLLGLLLKSVEGGLNNRIAPA